MAVQECNILCLLICNICCYVKLFLGRNGWVSVISNLFTFSALLTMRCTFEILSSENFPGILNVVSHVNGFWEEYLRLLS